MGYCPRTGVTQNRASTGIGMILVAYIDCYWNNSPSSVSTVNQSNNSPACGITIRPAPRLKLTSHCITHCTSHVTCKATVYPWVTPYSVIRIACSKLKLMTAFNRAMAMWREFLKSLEKTLHCITWGGIQFIHEVCLLAAVPSSSCFLIFITQLWYNQSCCKR